MFKELPPEELPRVKAPTMTTLPVLLTFRELRPAPAPVPIVTAPLLVQSEPVPVTVTVLVPLPALAPTLVAPPTITWPPLLMVSKLPPANWPIFRPRPLLQSEFESDTSTELFTALLLATALPPMKLLVTL